MKLDIITKARRALKISKKRKEDHVLLLRTCDEDLQAHKGFQWPGVGNLVSAPDWDPIAVCGYGLHGALWGVGDGDLLNPELSSKWMVVAARADAVVDLEGKVKVPKAFVCFVGNQVEATNWLVANSHVDMSDKPVIGLNKTVGHYESVVVGYRGSATAGYSGEATAGSRGRAVVGPEGTATAGKYGTATSGDFGNATAGRCGKATTGYRGTTTVGDKGTATAGELGRARAGYLGVIKIMFYEYQWEVGKPSRLRWAIGYVGENGIKPNVYYRVAEGKLTEEIL